MKKQILNIGKALNKVEQKAIIGGTTFGISDGKCNQMLEDEKVCTGYNVGCDLDANCINHNSSGFGQCLCAGS